MKFPPLVVLILAAPLLLVPPSSVFGASSSSSSSSSSGNKNYDKYFKNGEAAEKRNNWEDAVEFYRKALKAKPKDADALNNLGFSLRSVGKKYMMEAAKAYEEALEADGNHEEALEYQGELFLWMGMLEMAHANLEKLKSLQSDEAAELQDEIDAILEQAAKLL